MPIKKTKRIHKEAKDLFTVLDESAQLRMIGNNLTYKGKILPEVQKNRIAEESKLILSVGTWEVLMDDMKQVACRKMYEEATDEELLIGGKWMLYTLDVLQKKLYNLSKLKISKENKKV